MGLDMQPKPHAPLQIGPQRMARRTTRIHRPPKMFLPETFLMKTGFQLVDRVVAKDGTVDLYNCWIRFSAESLAPGELCVYNTAFKLAPPLRSVVRDGP